MNDTCDNPRCPICHLKDVSVGQFYRPHTLTSDCWCQVWKDTRDPDDVGPKRCWIDRHYADLLV